MKLGILAIGRLKEGPERELALRYGERARAAGKSLGFSGFDTVELAESRAGRAAERKADEAQALRARCGDVIVIALDERGPGRSSEEFAALLAQRRDAGARALLLVIGGADGLDPDFVVGAAERLSFGRMTLPHQIVRILAAEQLYRAMTILSGHPYHRS